MSAAFSEFLGRKQALRGLPEVGAAKVRIVGAMNTDLIARLPVRPPMTSDLDIYRSAKLLIDQHGEDASVRVSQPSKLASKPRLAIGRGARWLRVLKAVKELQRTRPRRDEATH